MAVPGGIRRSPAPFPPPDMSDSRVFWGDFQLMPRMDEPKGICLRAPRFGPSTFSVIPTKVLVNGCDPGLAGPRFVSRQRESTPSKDDAVTASPSVVASPIVIPGQRQNRDDRQWRRLVEDHLPAMQALCLRLRLDRGQSAEVIQLCWLRAAQRWPALPDPVRPWLLQEIADEVSRRHSQTVTGAVRPETDLNHGGKQCQPQQQIV